jgi:hypothetical protein
MDRWKSSSRHAHVICAALTSRGSGPQLAWAGLSWLAFFSVWEDEGEAANVARVTLCGNEFGRGVFCGIFHPSYLVQLIQPMSAHYGYCTGILVCLCEGAISPEGWEEEVDMGPGVLDGLLQTFRSGKGARTRTAAVG